MMGRALGLWAGRPRDCRLSGGGPRDCGLSGATRFVLDIITLGWGGINRWRQQHLSPRQCCYL